MCSHRLAIAKLVREFKEPLFSHSSQVSRHNKQELWEYIRQQAVSQGASQYAKKSWKEIRDCVWAPIRRDTMAKLNKAKTVGEDSVVFTEIDKIVIEIISTIGPMGWNTDDETTRTQLDTFSDNSFNDVISSRQHRFLDNNNITSGRINDNHDNNSDDDVAEIEAKPCESLTQMLELMRDTPFEPTRSSKFSSNNKRNSEINGFLGECQSSLSNNHQLNEDQYPQNVYKRKALEQPQLEFQSSSLSPVFFYDSDAELERAIKRAKLEHLHLQKILLKEQIQEKRLQNQLLQIEIKSKK